MPCSRPGDDLASFVMWTAPAADAERWRAVATNVTILIIVRLLANLIASTDNDVQIRIFEEPKTMNYKG